MSGNDNSYERHPVTKARSARLAALTAAAMALPGVHARAAAPGENPWGVEATHLEYSDSGSRMNVRVNQASAVVPIARDFQLRAISSRIS